MRVKLLLRQIFLYIKKPGCTAALSTRAKDGDAGSVVAGHIIIGTPALFFCSSHHDSLGLGSTLICSSSLLHKISQPIMSWICGNAEHSIRTIYPVFIVVPLIVGMFRTVEIKFVKASSWVLVVKFWSNWAPSLLDLLLLQNVCDFTAAVMGFLNNC